MKLNLLIFLMLLSIVSCKKDKETDPNGQWDLKNHSIIFYDKSGNKILEDKSDDFSQFSKVQLSGDSIATVTKTPSVIRTIKTNLDNVAYLDVRESLSTIMIEFQTVNEINTKYWTIERSGNNIDFLPIKTITAERNSSKSNVYSYLDVSPLFGENHYRIKKLDDFYLSTYSSVVSISMNFVLNKTNGKIYLPANLITRFKEVEVTFVGNKMFWKAELDYLLYPQYAGFEIKNAAKCKLQMEFNKN